MGSRLNHNEYDKKTQSGLVGLMGWNTDGWKKMLRTGRADGQPGYMMPPVPNGRGIKTRHIVSTQGMGYPRAKDSKCYKLLSQDCLPDHMISCSHPLSCDSLFPTCPPRHTLPPDLRNWPLSHGCFVTYKQMPQGKDSNIDTEVKALD